MKRIISTILVVSLALAISSCGGKEEKSYADQLVDGDVAANAEVDLSKAKDKKEAESDKKEVKVSLEVSEEEMGNIIDSFNNEYKSITVAPIEEPDFFIGKTMRAVSYIENHEMTNVYELGITAEFTDSTMKMSYPQQDQTVDGEYIVYTVAPKVLTSAEGNTFSYVAYGSEEITSEETEGAIAVMGMVKMSESVDMGEAKSDTYVLLVETSKKDTYQLFKIM